MAGSDKTVKITLVAVAGPYVKGMNEASGSTKKLGTDMDGVDAKQKGFATSAGKATSALKGMAVAGAAVAGTALVAFLGDAVSKASDLQQTVSKSNIIFGDNAAKIEAWGETAAEKMGLSKTAAMSAAASFGDMFSQIGIAGDQAAKMSTDVVQLAADLGSFNNLPTAEVVDMISASFRGEYDSLQRVVPNINAARVQTEALATSGKTNAASLTAQEKALATLAIIQKDGARAQGDFARSSGQLAIEQQKLSAAWQDAQAHLGEALLPILTKVTEALRSGLDITLAVAGAWGNIPGPIKAAVVALTAFHLLRGPLSGMLSSTIEQIKSVGTTLKGAGVAGSAKGAGSALLSAFGGPQGLAIAGIAAGLGFVISGLQESTDRANRMRDALVAMYKAGGGSGDATSRLKAFTDSFEPKQLADYRDALEGVGIKWSDYLDAVAAGGSELDSMNGRVKAAYDSQGLFHGVMGEVVDVTQQWADENRGAAVTGKELADAADRAKKSTQDAVPVIDAAKNAQAGMAEATRRTTEALGLRAAKDDVARTAADSLRQTNQDLATALLAVAAASGDADRAEIGYQAAVDAASQSVKDNGKTLDTHTEKGRANATALLTLKDAALASAQANLTNGESTDTVKGKMQTARDEFIKVAMQMNGGNRKAAEDLATKYQLTGDTVDGLKTSMDKIPKEVVSDIKVNTAAAAVAVAGINALLDAAAKDRYATVYVQRVGTVGSTDSGDVFGRGGVRAAGGGAVYGPGSATSDSIPAMLSDGEYVVKAAAVDRYGVGFMHDLNTMRLAGGGPVGRMSPLASQGAPIDYGRLAAAIGERNVYQIASTDPYAAAREVYAQMQWRDLNG